MYRTIILGSCVTVQGIFLKNLKDGKIAVKVGNRIFEGRPVEQLAA